MNKATTENLPKVLSVLELLTEDELVQLNHAVIARLRIMQHVRAHGAMMNFRVGQRVKFTASTGQLIRGVLTKYNRKSVTLVTDAGQQWRVSPALLEPE